MFCKNCGQEINDNADICIHCGKAVKEVPATTPKEEVPLTKKGWFLAIICFFLGAFGVHRFMVGKIGTGVLWLFTIGFLGFGVLIDLIMLLCGSFKDKEGNKIPLGL
ncbi:MAG: TM2 domain-containing protein [Clostridia bacterium]|nr:TM2 domain-containing protein [Clostridia bacterium]